MKHKPVRKAVFPVAGLGTRFLPATKVMAKEMLTICDKPLIQHVVEEARTAGIEEFILVTSPSKEMLQKQFETHRELEQVLASKNKNDLLKKVRDTNIVPGKLKVTYQDKPLGLGHAIWCAKDLVGDEPFAVLLPDVLVKGPSCLKQMVDIYEDIGGNVIAVEDVPRDQTDKYGIVDIGGTDGMVLPVQALVEKPKPEHAPSTLSIIGRYILQPEIFDALSVFEKGAGGEIQLTDAMAKLIGKQPFHSVRFEGKSYDCGSKLGFIEANIAFGLADAEIGDQVQKIVNQFSSGALSDALPSKGNNARHAANS